MLSEASLQVAVGEVPIVLPRNLKQIAANVDSLTIRQRELVSFEQVRCLGVENACRPPLTTQSQYKKVLKKHTIR